MKTQTDKCSRPKHLSSNTREDENGSAIYSGNRLVRRQYFGSMENVNVQDASSSPMLRKAARFRVEPTDEVKHTQTNAWTPSLAQLENPEFQTRWYFKFFLGIVHNNYVFMDVNKEPHALSVCLTDLENHGIPQYRAILWKKSGCQRICFPYVPGKTYSSKEVLKFFSIDKLEKAPKEIISPDVQRELLVLEEQEGSVNFKFGVVYAMKGQTTDDEMFGNVKGSKEFDDFLHCLGDTVDLHGWTGYRGGLDVKDNTTGMQSLYTMFEGHEVMFHVSVMLPFSKDSQQVERKRHIGNDIAVIVFADGEPEEEMTFKPSSIRTNFIHVFAVVRFSRKTKSFWLNVYSEENVPVFGPPLPLPPRFNNPQEFRSFLLTKLMNGEKAAYVSPVFSNKRQRTLESLIKGLQNDQWAKPEKFMLKRAVSDQLLTDRFSSRERKRLFLEIGQSLKVKKIMQGHAPTSVANVGGLLAIKNTPWNPQRTLSTFTRKIHCGDTFGTSLLISCDHGIYHITDYGTRHIYDSSMAAAQINVLEDYGIFLLRTKKHGRIYVMPLAEIEAERPFTICRRQCARYYLRKTKGCHVYALSRQDSPFIALAFAVGKRLSLYAWSESSVWYANDENKKADQPPKGFELESEFSIGESPQTLTIVHDINHELLMCVGLRHRFDVINAQNKKISVLKNIVTYRKPKIVSALDVFDDNNPELLLTFSHTSVFVRLREGLSEIVSFNWNTAPLNIVCAYPYILGFSQNSIEIRLMVNGNLVHTLCVPQVKLLTAKSDIYLTSCDSSTISATKKSKNSIIYGTQTFYKIGLSDLAGLNNVRPAEDLNEQDIEDLLLRRNIGVYASYDHRKPKNSKNKLGVNMHVRTYSAAAAIHSMHSEKKESIKTVKEIDILESSITKSLSSEPIHQTKNTGAVKSNSCDHVAALDNKNDGIIKPMKTGITVPLWKLAEKNKPNKTLSVSDDKSTDLPKISLFYTPTKFSKRYSLQHPKPSGTIEKVNVRYVDGKHRTASVKSLPDNNQIYHTTNSPNMSKLKKLNKSTNALMERNGSWDCSVTSNLNTSQHSIQQPFISKKTTIV